MAPSFPVAGARPPAPRPGPQAAAPGSWSPGRPGRGPRRRRKPACPLRPRRCPARPAGWRPPPPFCLVGGDAGGRPRGHGCPLRARTRHSACRAGRSCATLLVFSLKTQKQNNRASGNAPEPRAPPGLSLRSEGPVRCSCAEVVTHACLQDLHACFGSVITNPSLGYHFLLVTQTCLCLLIGRLIAKTKHIETVKLETNLLHMKVIFLLCYLSRVL